MATIKILVRAEKMRKNGEVPLYIRMTSAGKSKYISLGQTIPPKSWDADREKVRKSHPNSARLNAFLLEKKAEVSALALDVNQGRKKIGRHGMRDALADGSGESFLDFADEFLDRLKRQERTGTLRNYKLAVSIFKRWLKDEKKLDDLSFSRFTSELAREFKTYLEVDLGNAPATITNRFAAFKSMLTTARDEEIVDASFRPLAGIKVRGKKSKKQIPSREEVAQLATLDVDPKHRKWHTRNLYLFCVNMAGLRFGDAVSLRWGNVVDDRLQWQTSKTNKQRLIYIPQEVREILDLYRNENGQAVDGNAFIFPFLKGNEHLRRSQLNKPIQVANTNCNKNLKKLWKDSGSAKSYSFHTSRHFFATDSLRRGMRVEVLQHLLTHSTLNQTMEYAQIANEDMDAAMKAYEAAKQA